MTGRAMTGEREALELASLTLREMAAVLRGVDRAGCAGISEKAADKCDQALANPATGDDDAEWLEYRAIGRTPSIAARYKSVANRLRSTAAVIRKKARPIDFDDEPDEPSEAIAWFGQNTRLELSHYSPVYCDDPDQSVEWRVHERRGSINDREWNLLGKGETPLAAIKNAMSQRKAKPHAEGGEA